MIKQNTPAKRVLVFNPRTFLSTIGKSRNILSFDKRNTIFAQGDLTDGLFFIQEGKVQLSVVSEAGEEATLGILSEGDFFGEGGLAGPSPSEKRKGLENPHIPGEIGSGQL